MRSTLPSAASSQGWNVRGIDVAKRANPTVWQPQCMLSMSCESLEQIGQRGLVFDAVTRV